MKKPTTPFREPVVRNKMVQVNQYPNQPAQADNAKWNAKHLPMYQIGYPHNYFSPHDSRNRNVNVSPRQITLTIPNMITAFLRVNQSLILGYLISNRPLRLLSLLCPT
jgi:hypothetical protein